MRTATGSCIVSRTAVSVERRITDIDFGCLDGGVVSEHILGYDFFHSEEKTETYYDYFDHENTWFDVQLEEGKTYSLFIIAQNEIYTNICKFGYPGESGSYWGDTKFWLDEVKIEYHNPPLSPPIGEHPPELTNFVGDELLIIGRSGTYTVHATDLDGDQIQYKFDWGDGTTTGWTDNPTQTHIYGRIGKFDVFIKIKDKSEYELQNSLSEPMEVYIRNPQGTIIIDSPVSGSKWKTGSTQSIEWSYVGESINEVYFTLHKKSDPDFTMVITEEPISPNYIYRWNIPKSIAAGNDYQIAVWSIANYSFSNEFSIVKGTSSAKNPILANLLQKLLDLFPRLEPILEPIIDQITKNVDKPTEGKVEPVEPITTDPGESVEPEELVDPIDETENEENVDDQDNQDQDQDSNQDTQDENNQNQEQTQSQPLDIIYAYANKDTAEEDEDIQFCSYARGGEGSRTYHWDFGDETTSTQRCPTYAYEAEGEYTPVLTVTDEIGDTITQELDTIEIVDNNDGSNSENQDQTQSGSNNQNTNL
jgi:PKD repeat protein